MLGGSIRKGFLRGSENRGGLYRHLLRRNTLCPRNILCRNRAAAPGPEFCPGTPAGEGFLHRLLHRRTFCRGGRAVNGTGL